MDSFGIALMCFVFAISCNGRLARQVNFFVCVSLVSFCQLANMLKIARRALFKKYSTHSQAINTPGRFNITKELAPGVLQLPIHKPQDFEYMIYNSLHKCNTLRDNIVATKVKGTEQAKFVINGFDEISNELCLLLDAMEFLRNNHSDENMRVAANDVLLSFSEYLHTLNTDVALHLKIAEICNNEEMFANLEETYQQCAKALKKDMEKHGGVHNIKDNSKKERMVQLNSAVDALISDFMQYSGETNPKLNELQVPITLKDKVPNNVDIVWKKTHGVVAPQHYGAIYSSAKDSDLRRQAFILKYTAHDKALKALDELVKTRQELAHELGFPSYAEIVTRENMIESEANIVSLLTGVAEKIKPKVAAEMELIRQEKIKHENDDKVYAWDISYYRSKIEDQLKLNDGALQYLALDDCVHAIQQLCKQVFGIAFEPVAMPREETWHPSVKKYMVHHDKNGLLGTMYLDLYQRPEKNHQAANYTIRCAKVKTNQKPVTVLSCGFHTIISGRCHIRHSEFETLLHEMGHALHVLTGQTDWQNLAGTRSAIDFVEMPSQLMENYAWNYDFLRQFAKHYRTGEPLPMQVLATLKRSDQFFSGLELQEQLLLSLYDVLLYGKRDTETKNMSAVELYKFTRNKYHSTPFVEGTSYPGQFQHLTNYAGAYYSYLYCHMFSAHIWNKHFGSNPFSRTTGDRFLTQVLQPGGSRDPKLIRKDILDNEEINPIYLFKEYGIST